MEPTIYLAELAETLQSDMLSGPIAAIAQALWETYTRDGAIIVCGNGGSAATASHVACDLAKWTICEDCRRVRALALTDNVPLMTAWSNDAAYEQVFVEQLKTHYRDGDTLVAICSSGNSLNVLHAVDWANARGATTIGLSGFDGGVLSQRAQIVLVVPSHLMPLVEDVHLAACHALAIKLRAMIAQARYQAPPQ